MRVKQVIRKRGFFLLSLVLAGFFRLVNLTIIPIFADEAIYIHWSQLAWHDHTKRFISLTDGKPPLHTWLMIPFLKIINNPLIAGRLLSAIAGLGTLIGLYLIVKKVFDDKKALLAAFFTVLCPFLVFYDRLAVADSLLTALGVWSFYLGLLLLEKPDLGKAFLVGFCWGGGLLTKQTALYFIVLSPLLIFFSLYPSKKNLKKKLTYFIKNQLAYLVFACLLAFLAYNVVKLSPFSHLISSRSYDYILGKREFLKDPFQLLWGNLRAITAWLGSYQLKVGVFLFFLGLAWMIKDNWLKAVVFSGWLMIPLLGSAAIGKIIFPRYFVFVQPWVIVFIAYGVDNLIKISKKLPRAVFLSVMLFPFLPWLIFSCLLVFQPLKAPLIKREQDQYLTSWSSGWGIKPIADYLKEKHPQELIYVATEGYFGTLPDGLEVFLDGFSNIQVYGIGQPIGHIPEETLSNADQAPAYLIVNDNRYLGQGENLELIKKFPKPKFPFLEQSLLFFKIERQ